MEFLLLLLFVPLLCVGLFEDRDDEDDAAPDVNGTAGDDILPGTQGREEINAGAGDDDIAAWDGDDTVNAEDGNDDVLGEVGNDLVFGGAGDDLVDGGAGNDTIWMGEGDDVIADDELNPGPEFNTGAEGDDKISGGGGNDMIGDWLGENDLSGELGADFIWALDDMGTDDHDALYGGWGADTLWGDDGDMLTGGGTSDAFHVAVDETDDTAVAISDFDAEREVLHLELDSDTFEGATADDLSIATNPETGDVTVSFAGQAVVVLVAPSGFDRTNVVLPDWLAAA